MSTLAGLQLALKHCTKYEDRMFLQFLIKVEERNLFQMNYLEDIVDEDTLALEVEMLKLRIQEAILKRLEHEKTVDREEAVLITYNAVKELIHDFVPARYVIIKHNIQ